jgi:hypothetical protein
MNCLYEFQQHQWCDSDEHEPHHKDAALKENSSVAVLNHLHMSFACPRDGTASLRGMPTPH